jgi:signal transduction histidine kinase
MFVERLAAWAMERNRAKRHAAFRVATSGNGLGMTFPLKLERMEHELEALSRRLRSREQEIAALRDVHARLAQLLAIEVPNLVGAAISLCQTELASSIVTRRMRPLRAIAMAEQVTQVLALLLRNAAHATRGTGRPSVIHIDARAQAARVHIRVSDNGTGPVAPDFLRQIAPWEAGESIAGASCHRLLLCQAIVRAHGGALLCAKRWPHGCRFEFDLPLLENANP